MRVPCIIIARGGSKGVPRKNFHDFCGLPLISWTISQAKKAELISEIWVSSDDEQAFQIALDLGVHSIKRPKKFAEDSSSSESAWLHALEKITQVGQKPIDYLVLPQVTSPIREASDFDAAINHLIDEKADSLFSASMLEDHFCWKKNRAGELVSLNYNFQQRKRRQNLEPTYLENGSFWITKPSVLKENGNRLGGKITFYEMEKFKSLQIDNLEDFKFCEVVMKGFLLTSRL